MKEKIIFASINSERDKKFQICTKIIDRNGKRFVRKEALNKESIKHIQNIISNETILKETYMKCKLFRICKAVNKDENFVEYVYLDEESLEKHLDSCNEEEKIRQLNIIWNELLKCNLSGKKESGEYRKVFGDSLIDIEDLHWSINQDVDLLFSNLYLKDDKYIINDYEWVFPFAVPLEFVFFRSVYYSAYLTDKERYYRIAGIDSKNIERFIAAENCFQDYVKKDAVSLWDRFDVLGKGHENWEIKKLRNKEKQEREDNQYLRSQLQNIEVELNNKNEQIVQLLASERELNEIKESMFVKAMYGWYRLRDKLLPKGSRRRIVIKVFADIIRHPVKTISKLSLQRIGKFIIFLIKGDVNRIAEKFDDITISDFERMKLDVSSGNNYKKLYFNEIKDPLVSVIVPVYNQFDYTYHCLEAILKHCKNVSYEVILADDNSNDQTEKINEYAENVRIIRNKENLGFLRNCNSASKYASGKYIVFLNNDTQVQERWLESMLELIESDVTIGMVGSRLVYPDGSLQEAGGIIWADGSGWNYGRGRSPLDPEYNYVKDVDYISGASIMIRRDLWKKIGGFDERYAPAYYEDSDLAFSVRKQGYRVVYQPQSVVVHFEGVTNGTDENSGHKQYQKVNKEKFVEKWKNELKDQYPSESFLFKARERGKNKKTVVFIDHYVPQYDKDAGSKSSISYMKLFLNKGYTVKLIPDNFYKDEPYTTQFQQMGIEVLYGDWYANHIFDWLQENSKDIDYIFSNRPHITIKYIDFIKDRTDIKLVYYGHDLHFLRTKREYEVSKDPEILKEMKDWEEKETHILKKADMSYYPSYVEEKTIKELDSSIRVKAIPLYIYDQFREDIGSDFKKRKGLLFVGGFRHRPNLDAVKWLLEDIYPNISEEIGPLYIVGSNPPEELIKFESEKVIIKGFVSEEELKSLYDSCRLVVAPLRYGAGIKGKIIEAMYNGVPTVTTSIGAEGIIDSDEVLFIEDDAQGIAETINKTYNDVDLLKERSVKSLEYVKNHFSADNAWNIIKEDFS